MLKTLQNYSKKNERTSEHTNVQNHTYANKSRYTYVRDVCQLSNPAISNTYIQNNTKWLT